MSLREIGYLEDYRSGEDDLLSDFFRPSLGEATAYWRAVGYFRSSALEAFGAPLNDFIKRGGTIRLITSVDLTEDDVQAIDRGLNKREICDKRIAEIIEVEFTSDVGNGVSNLATLLSVGRLEIQIAVPKKGRGIYHEKVGLFFDDETYVAFSGSANESRTALEGNYECIDVFPSWNSEVRAKRKLEHFERLWSGDDRGADVYPFPEAAAKALIRIASRPTGLSEPPSDYAIEENTKWRHQNDALEEFLESERGVLEMATGTGKTRTALKIMVALYKSNKIDTVIVATNGTDLLDQWYGELLHARTSVGRSLRVYRQYDARHETQDFSLAPEGAILLTSRKPLASALRQLTLGEAKRTLLIHDEVHGFGSPANRAQLAGLSNNVRFRLGLSATPERKYDKEGNDFIKSEVGPSLTPFELDDAIRRGILAPFDYHPLRYDLTQDDRQRLKNVYKQKAARAAEGNPMSDEEVWMQIARVYKTSKAKIPVFKDFIRQNTELLRRCLIFVETQEYGLEVLDLVHEHRPDFHSYFSGEDSETLKQFARGDLECLVTCHRLSEGIDIQSLNSVILFSSARARLETIQRMGRCLRTDPLNPEKIANIVDFIRAEDDESKNVNADEERCEWLTALASVRPEECEVVT